MRFHLTICWLVVNALPMVVAGPTTRAAEFYFSAAGNDLTGNGTLANPWKSVTKFNSLDFNPGDGAYFRGGDEFAGRLFLNELDGGTNAAGQLLAPIKIGAYLGDGTTARPRIVSPANSEALFAYNNGGLELDGLEFISGGYTSGTRKSGVLFSVDKNVGGGLQQYHHLRVTNVAAHGFSDSGLELYAENGVGYADVEIADSEFLGNAFSGVSVGAARWQDLIHANVTIDGVLAHDNPGYSGASPHSGHGVVVAQVDGAVVQNSAAYNNGLQHGGGNIGIWAWQANNVAIRNNVAYGNRSPDGGDGGGFDLDGGVTNSVVEYNRSYDNDGAGLLLAQFGFAEPMQHNVFRYNVSVNDGRDGYGGITVWGNSAADLAQSAVFHNNTVVVDKSVAPNARGPVWFLGGEHNDVDFINNAFAALNGAALISGTTTTAKATFVRNAYWTAGGPIKLEDATYASVQAWANAEAQEKLGGSFVAVTGDPAFAEATTFRPQAYSPLIGTALAPGGLPWPAWLTSLGARDFIGTPTPQEGAADIGAWEVLVADFDGDGHVGAGDLAAWLAGFGSSGAAGRIADLDGDGATGGGEFLQWQLRFGNPRPTAQLSIPEPSAGRLFVALMAFGGLGSRGRRYCFWYTRT